MRVMTAFAVVVALVCSTAVAKETCQPSRVPPLRLCEASVDPGRLQEVVASELKPEWCWGASVEMAFRYEGHPVAQSAIVKTVTAAPSDAAAIKSALNRDWLDEAGHAFRASADVFEAQSGSFGASNAEIVQALRDNHPLIVGTQTHAMLVIAIQYLSPPSGGVAQVMNVTVRDPWPGEGRRQLRLDELLPRSMARLHLEEIERPAMATAAGCTSDADCKGGRLCQAGSCVGVAVKSCAKDTDCPGTQICSSSGVCAATGNVQSTVWRAPEKPAREDKREKCSQRCEAIERGCVNDLMSVDLCLQTRADTCVRDCVMNKGYPEAQCRAELCSPGMAANGAWTVKCQSDFHDDQESCRKDRTTCQTACQ